MPNQSVPKELTAAQVTAIQDASFPSDGLADAGVQMSDLDRGFIAESLTQEGREDADGTNYVGDPYAPSGFMGVTSKYQRL